MEYYQGNIIGKPNELRVYLLNDLHFGSEAVNFGLWEKIKKDIREHRENSRILLNGDLIECVTKTSKGDVLKQRLSPEEQIVFVANELREFADLIDAVTIGNHECRLKEETSIDPILYLCRMLGIEDKYIGYEGLVAYSWRKCYYTIQMFHGSGGATTPQAIINRMKKMRKTNCDVFYIGHHHKEVTEAFIEYQTDPYNKSLQRKKRWLVCGNTITNYAEYAQRYGYIESYPSQAVLILSGNPNNKGIEIEWIREI